MAKGLRRTLGEIEEPRPQRRAGRRRRDDPPPPRLDELVAAAPAIAEVEAKADEIGEQFEDEVRMQPQRAELDPDRKAQNASTPRAAARSLSRSGISACSSTLEYGLGRSG